MSLYQFKNSQPNPEAANVPFEAVQLGCHNFWQCEALCGPFILQRIPINRPDNNGNAVWMSRVLLCDPLFPCWIDPGDWLTKNDAGEIDVWPAVHFADKFELVAEGNLHEAPAAELPILQLRRSTAVLVYFIRCERRGIGPLTDARLDREANEIWQQAEKQLAWIEFADGSWRLTQRGRIAVDYAEEAAAVEKISAAGSQKPDWLDNYMRTCVATNFGDDMPDPATKEEG